MKVYIQEISWMGCIIVIANSESEDREIMSSDENYEANRGITEKEICIGVVHINYGVQ